MGFAGLHFFRVEGVIVFGGGWGVGFYGFGLWVLAFALWVLGFGFLGLGFLSCGFWVLGFGVGFWVRRF